MFCFTPLQADNSDGVKELYCSIPMKYWNKMYMEVFFESQEKRCKLSDVSFLVDTCCFSKCFQSDSVKTMRDFVYAAH